MFGYGNRFQGLVQFHRRGIGERWWRFGPRSGTIFVIQVQVHRLHRVLLQQQFWSQFSHHVTSRHDDDGLE